ncbi:hypothetical protein ACFYU9_20760 [Streptomyces sp. NPDC004327]|uniref:BACON domain-containing protein n=1 Tax=Streptomyces sp. NPDC004327 TaxID=3364699 RepID=UPI0036798E78
MTSSRLEHPTHPTWGHPRTNSGGGPRTPGQRPPARYEEYLDGLFTYCLSVLCDHDTATAVLGDVLAIAERHHGRCPSDEPGRRAWLYALARWACLRSLGEQRRRRQGGAHTGRPAVAAPEPPRVAPEVAERRRAELAALAWPEAAGTTPEQREALELAVRHGLGHHEVAAVLSLDPVACRELLSSAACEVERTRAALAVVETGDCPTVARLTGDHQVLLSAALRAELVRHVDDCPACRRAAERAGAGAPWPGAPTTARLPVVEAPRAAAYVAMLHVPRARAGAPRFGPTGFPMDPKDHAARRDRMRTRAVTTTVVAAVVAAPVLALWASYRGTPVTVGEGHDASRISARDLDEPGGAQAGGADGGPYERYENTGDAGTDPDPRFTRGSRSPDVSVEVISPGAPAAPTPPGQPAAARIAVTARGSGATTLLTLTNEGGRPGSWSLWSDAPWLYVSRASGTLRPGESVTVRIFVDRHREPAGAWSARVGVNPSGAVVRIGGYGATPPPPATTGPSSPPPGTTDPTTPPPTSEPPTTPPPSTTEPTTDPTTDPTTAPTSGQPTTDPTADPAPSPTDSAPPDSGSAPAAR